MGKNFLSVFLAVFIFSLSLCLNVNAASQYTGVSITTVIQAKSNWCWAACAQMGAKNAYSSSTRDRYDIVHYIFDNESVYYPNYGASIYRQSIGAKYATNNKSFGYTYSAWSFSKLKDSLAKGYAIQTAGGYYSGTKRTGGHMVIVCGVQFINNSSGLSYYVDYKDPIDGSNHHCTYEQFCNGGYNGRKYDQTVYVI